MPKNEIKKANNNNELDKDNELIELENELITINPNIFQGINPKKKEELLRIFSVSMIQEKSHSKPLPDAETLIKYNSVIPDGADRIMKMAEKQQHHRMQLKIRLLKVNPIKVTWDSGLALSSVL